MTYATTYRIGYNQITPRAQTKAIAPPVKRLRQLDAENQRCKRSQKRQATERTDSNVANGFLKTLFLPKLKETETVQACNETGEIEKDFYQSLYRLAEHYGLNPMQTKSFEFPYNMALSLWDTEEQLKNRVKEWEAIELIQDRKRTYFTSEERYSTGATLYYIPVLPLYRLLRNPNRKQASLLLLSVCSYLYHIADIPYYRQESSYLYWMYDMVADWVLSDDENEDTAQFMNEYKQSEWVGEFMEKKIFNHHNLSLFSQRLQHFESRDKFDQDCYCLAKEAFELSSKFPNQSVFGNAKPNGEAEEDDMENIIGMEKYVSFCANTKGYLFDTLFDSVNNELQEYGQMEEPIIIKRFDGSNVTDKTLEFEKRLFALIEELTYLLNNY
ncbi:hypothetical protein [Sphingobacterium siyangense]|uniref:Uncharacterized protein n=1 Tax=Sphingobacterium siyangense TaxID=459529 RepID=A0A562MKB2_9SPHI|nr:hypothetical protein [Sphingobacterium siyangense]TWI20306.1 hypothetical protein IQ31_02261 [Sphingobacterium siyangense]